MSEKSVRTGNPVDEQFEQLVDAKDASITITISSEFRQVGKVRLTKLLNNFLKDQGYTNVSIAAECGIDDTNVKQLGFSMIEEDLRIIELQKQVRIDLKLVDHK